MEVYEGGLAESSAPQGAQAEVASPRRLGYQPALDGVRGVAVALVVVFHLDVGFLTGGYLGVSVFFTLSGFLITTLLLERHEDTGSLGLGGFYIRRIKRLVPASALTLFVIAAVTAGGGFLVTDRTRGDITAAALNVFNWREVASGRAYADLFTGQSPVAHFWSLAIEEQFYVVWPLLLLGLLRLGRGSVRRVLPTIIALFVASTIAAQFGSANLVYFASWNRAAEILAGAGLAAWMLRSQRVPAWWRRLALPALLLILVLCVITPAATGWAYNGGLPLFSLVSVAVIAGLQVPGRTRTGLSFGPLVALGRISYGVYLVHWPVFVYVDEVRMGVGGWSLALTRLSLTAVLSLMMYFVLERPIRRSDQPRSFGVAIAAALTATLLVVMVVRSGIEQPEVAAPAPAVLVAAPEADASPLIDVTSDAEPEVSAVPASSPRLAPPAPGEPTEPVVAADRPSGDPETRLRAAPDPNASISEEFKPTTIAVFGDSVPAWLLRDAAFAFARRDVVLVNGTKEACDGAVAIPLGRDRKDNELRPPDDCQEWTQSYPAALASYDHQAEVGLLVLGQTAAVDHLIDGEWRHPCDSLDWYLSDVRQRIEYLRTVDVQPVLALPARFGKRATFVLPDDYADRMACVRTALVALAFEQQVETVDLDGLLCIGDDCDGRRVRDGIHVDAEVAAEVLDELVDLTLATR